jgi:hypothetical protein
MNPIEYISNMNMDEDLLNYGLETEKKKRFMNTSKLASI